MWKPVGLGMIHGSLSNDFHDHDVHADIRYPAGANLVRHFFFIGGLSTRHPSFLDSISTVTVNRPFARGCTRTTCSLRSFPFATMAMYLDLQKIPDGASRTFRQPSQLPYVAPLECADISYRLT